MPTHMYIAPIVAAAMSAMTKVTITFHSMEDAEGAGLPYAFDAELDFNWHTYDCGAREATREGTVMCSRREVACFTSSSLAPASELHRLRLLPPVPTPVPIRIV